MLYLYAIAESDAAAPAVRGHDERELVSVAEGRLAGVCSEHDAPPEPTPEAVRRHGAVVDALARGGPVLPARFGVAFGDEQRLRARLAERREELAAALERVRGRVELGVRILAPRAEPRGAATDGRAYLLGRLDEQRRMATVADELHGALAGAAAAATVRVTPLARPLLSAAYLVDAGAVDAFRACVEALATDHPELDVVLTGPWPPYSFTAAGEGHA